MIKGRIISGEAQGWEVNCYLAVDTYYIPEIIADLRRLRADWNYIKKAHRLMSSRDLDTGLCYSNLAARQSIIVIGLASSAEEYFNSITHEIAHLTSHIAETMNLDYKSEKVCYIARDIASQLYGYCKSLLCDDCLKKATCSRE